MDLYLFYIGGNAGKSNIEVHDIQFVAAEKPSDAWPVLREAWFGDPNKLHIDGYTRLTWADGYDITLHATPQKGQSGRLYFVNAGAYRSDQLAELHEFGFFVANTAREAKQKALNSLLSGYNHQHKDNLKDVDDCLVLKQIGEYHIHLTPNSVAKPLLPEWQGYQPIGI